MFEKETIKILFNSLSILENGYKHLPEANQDDIDYKKIKEIMYIIAEKLQNNYPYFHPLYAGQMLKPPHPIARAAYMLAMWINPNNHALDGGRASSIMEKEAVSEISKMFGWDIHLGHLTSAGTTANLEALWVAGKINPDKRIVFSSQAHYTHDRMCKVLGLKSKSINTDKLGKMNIDDLKKELEKGDIGTIVATIGTTATGSIDSLIDILDLKKIYDFRVHVDAAYGGYFNLASNLDEKNKMIFERINEVDSIVIDPHKHGLQPYGCGCVLFRDPSVGSFYKHNSPYTYFTSSELHLGEISLECSRAGAAAVALWATQKMLPLVKNGEFSKSISMCREAALRLYSKLKNDNRFITAFPPELDIVVWVPKGESVSEISNLSKTLFDEAAKLDLHLAIAELPHYFFDFSEHKVKIDRDTVTVLRSVLMKPEHYEWIDRIWEILIKAMNNIN